MRPPKWRIAGFVFLAVIVLAVALGTDLGVRLHILDERKGDGSTSSSVGNVQSTSSASTVESAAPSSGILSTSKPSTASTTSRLESSSTNLTSTTSISTSSTTYSSSNTLSSRSTFSSSTTSTSTSSILYSTTTPTNPVKLTGTPSFLGNVTSSNTNDIRDLGWQGQVGSTWINTYGDTIPCPRPGIYTCAGLEASNSASVPTHDPLKYTDVDTVTGKNGKTHATGWCPLIDGEPYGFGLGLSSVIQMDGERGVVYYLRNNRSITPNVLLGSGIALVHTSGTVPVCSRPTVQSWDINEPYFGDHAALLAPNGYIYAYGGYNYSASNGLFLTRVPQASALTLTAYEYWNGSAFTSERLYNPTSDQSVLTAGQGSVLWSPLYSMFLYFRPGCPGGACILVLAANQPQGPWSDSVEVWGTGDSPDGFLMYAPAVQPKWSDVEVTNLVLLYTGRGPGFGNVLQAINMTFTK